MPAMKSKELACDDDMIETPSTSNYSPTQEADNEYLNDSFLDLELLQKSINFNNQEER